MGFGRTKRAGPLDHSPCPKPPPPVISRKPDSSTIRSAARGVTPRSLAISPADTNGFAITSLISSGSFDDVRFPASLRSIMIFAKPVVLLQPKRCGRQQTMSNGQQSRFPVAMPTPIHGNGFQAKIDGGEMGAAGDAGFPKDRRRQQAAEPGRVLQHGQFVPGIEGDDGLQYRRQGFGLAQHAAPFVEPGILVPIEIVNQRIFSAARLSPARLGRLACSIAASDRASSASIAA
nr:hypothetical protein K4M19_00093 [Agrobacterium fabrum]